LRRELFLLGLMLAGQGFAQILRGEGTGVGSRSGQEVDFRFYAGVGGSNENGLLPFTTDSNGNLVKIPGLWGVEGRIGAYGSHNWRHSRLGLDYAGAFRHYPGNSFFDSTDHGLSLSWMQQISPRIVYTLGGNAGTYGRAGVIKNGGDPAIDNPAATAASQFFDTRTNFGVSSASITYSQSMRTSYTFGGDAFLSKRRAFGLADSYGYSFTGSWLHQLNVRSTVGARYAFGRYLTPNQHLDSNSNTVEGTFGTLLGQRWSLNVRAGIFLAHVQSQQTIQLDPVLAALFGTPSIVVGFSQRNIFPSGSVELRRQFQRAIFSATYSQSMGAGNGVVSVARLESGSAALSYTGLRRWSLGTDAGFYRWGDLSRSSRGTATFNIGGGATYELMSSVHLSARYDSRHIEIDTSKNYPASSYRATFSVYFSPGNIPLSLW